MTAPPTFAPRVRKGIVAAATAAIVAGTAACSSSGGSGSSPSSSSSSASSSTPATSTAATSVATSSAPVAAAQGVDAAFLARLDHECAAANTYGAKHPFPFPNFDPTKPDVRDLPAIGRYFKASPDVGREILALGPPAKGVAAWDRAVVVLKEYEANRDAQIAAAAASNKAGFLETVNVYPMIAAKINTVSADAGLNGAKSCVTYFSN